MSYWSAPKGLFADTNDVAGVFRKIYDDRVWGGGSGIGSDPNVARPYLNFLQNFLIANDVGSVVDIGCGDWQFSRFIDWKNATYHGIDVVPSVIEANTRQFTRANIRFTCGNPLDDTVDVGGGDLLLLKDVLQHLSNANVIKLLDLTKRFKFSLITNAYAISNSDCNNGDTRPLDIRRPPFNVRHAAGLFGMNEKAVFLVVSPDAAR